MARPLPLSSSGLTGGNNSHAACLRPTETVCAKGDEPAATALEVGCGGAAATAAAQDAAHEAAGAGAGLVPAFDPDVSIIDEAVDSYAGARDSHDGGLLSSLARFFS